MPKPKIGHFTGPAGRAAFEAAYREGLHALAEPADVRDLSTPYGMVRAYRFGTAPGPPLVLLHGRGGTAVSWRPNVEALAARRTVHVLDMLGEPGGSVQTEPIRNAADQAEWLAHALDALGSGPVHLVGVSIGGWAAANLAVRRPEQVASISLLDPANTFARIPLRTVLRTIPTVLPFTAEKAMPRFLAWVDGRGPVPEDDPVGNVIAAALRHYRTALPMPSLITDEQLRGIQVPTLAVIAGRSVMHDPALALRRAELVPGAEVELWGEATHALSGQCATEVNARVLRFTNAQDRASEPRQGRPPATPGQ